MGISWQLSHEEICQCSRCRFDPWVGKIPGEGNGNPIQYSCLGNPMDRGAWRATVHGVAKSQTRLKQLGMNPFCLEGASFGIRGHLAKATSEHSVSSPVRGYCCRPHPPTAQAKHCGQVPTSTAHLWLCLDHLARQPRPGSTR